MALRRAAVREGAAAELTDDSTCSGDMPDLLGRSNTRQPLATPALPLELARLPGTVKSHPLPDPIKAALIGLGAFNSIFKRFRPSL